MFRILISLLSLCFYLVAFTAQAGALLPRGHFVESIVANAENAPSNVVQIKGLKRPVLKPRFNAAAKAKPPRGASKSVSRRPPTSARKSVAGPRSVTGRKLRTTKQIQSVRLPSGKQRISVSPKSARKFSKEVSKQGRALAAKPLTKARVQNVRSALRSTKPPEKISKKARSRLTKGAISALRSAKLKGGVYYARAASLRGKVKYKAHGYVSPLKHIKLNHGHDTTVPRKGRFAKMSDLQLRSLIKTGLKRGNVTQEKDGSFIVRYKTNKPIGKNTHGKTSQNLFIRVRDGKVHTAYPE